MTNKQIRTLDTLDICSNILAVIQIMVTILIVIYGRNSEMNYFFIFTAFISVLLIKKVAKRNK